MESCLLKKWPDEYYCTLHSTDYIIVSKNSNGISDPTGSRAVKLADLSRCRSDDYFYYKQLKQTITNALQQFNGKDLFLLKVDMGIKGHDLMAAAEEIGCSYEKAKKKVSDMIRIFNRKITRLKIT